MTTEAVRYDAVPLRAVRTPEGYLRDSPTIARTGVQTYRMNGRMVREYKGPEVYDAAALAGIRGLPIIDRHQPAITAQNVRQHIVGTVLSEGRLDGIAIAADVIVYDEAPVKAGRKELSLAYAVSVDETPGVAPDGAPYDQRVTAIRRFDHLAIEERGRAGISALRLDAADGVSADLTPDEPAPGAVLQAASATHSNQEGQTVAEPSTVVQVRLDGMNFAVPPDVATALERTRRDAEDALTKTRGDLDAAVKRADAAEVARDTEKARAERAEGEREAATKRADTAEAGRDAEKTRADAAEAKQPQIAAEAAAAARARLALEATAKAHGVEVRADASDADVRSAVILKLAPKADLAGKTAEYLSARFDAEVERASALRANGGAQVTQASAPVQSAARADAAAPSTVARSSADVARALAAVGRV